MILTNKTVNNSYFDLGTYSLLLSKPTSSVANVFIRLAIFRVEVEEESLSI